MTKQFYTMDALTGFLADNHDKVKSITVTKFDRFDFNIMEGNQITFNADITTIDGYRNKRVSIYTNSTYFEWYEIEDTAEATREFLENLYI